ncbi:cell surface protein SprA [Cyclobacterium lianum]|uniref:Cell surface protein SprA n=2 Tax=Cyclobacterium lianum TaxID=388280 RepID=A0A1M7PWQ8_9BACT|nr:cell surface protein SprA [Cyclobacterium lianum]SHN22032.1 cell surface protein SprA [Cyclobacterium lianum]
MSGANAFQEPAVTPADSLPDRLDTLSKRKDLPSFLLWDNLNTNPLYPSQNPFLRKQSPFLPGAGVDQRVEVEVDTAVRYRIYQNLDSGSVDPGYSMDFEDYSRMQELRIRQEYWRNRSRGLDGESAVGGRGLIPPITMSPTFDRIFGGSEISIVPTGNVNLDFGGIFRRIDNPSIPIRQQRNGGFNFNQQIQMSVNGMLGQKVRIGANFDSNNSFDFENQLKVEYAGFEEDILKTIEIGNVSMPVQNSLIQGAQNLFGVKTQMQFGKLFMTTVASTQRGRRDEIVLEGGNQGRPFEVRASAYDENRHFFLGHFFRNNFENWLRGLPQVLSGVQITRLEVYIMNRANNTQTLRNFAAFMDLGEGQRIYDPENPAIGQGNPQSPAANEANELFNTLRNNSAYRDFETAAGAISSDLGLERGVEFEQINGARKLADNEYTFHPQLGYFSLSRKLQNDEVIAVSYEYTYNGQRYKVGELSEDYQNRPEDNVIFLKMLRPARINTRIPTWDLMMKNIYNLNANQIQKEGFQLQIIYRDDRTGLDNPSLLEGQNVKDIPLIRLLKLDNLNPQNDPQPDGNFDYVQGLTIIPEQGLVIFPVVEPFGNTLEENFLPSEQSLKEKFVYDTLYRTTQADAELVTRLNKYFLKGSFTSGSASEIMLPGLNISEGSVLVTAGNIPLTEGVDYTVDYNIGRVVIINEGILQSGKRISVSFEKADLVSFQTRSLLGTRLDYMVNDNFNIGGTFLYLNERPNISRIATGNETLRNSLWGFDVNYDEESLFLTKLADALPFTETKEESLIQFNGEFAHLIPGTSNQVDGEGASYIDDFETAIIPFNLGSAPQTWKLAATPATNENKFDESQRTEDRLGNAYKRARLSWYTIDNVFYRPAGRGVPPNITNEDRRNHYVRRVLPQEIYRGRNRDVLITPEPLFEMAYFPHERGMYNFNPALDASGLLPDPRENYGGITRAITSEVDFDRTNIEYIEFWLMDPFLAGPNGRVLDGIFNENNNTGGKLVFNLGEISEDLVVDGRHAFENGLPADGADEGTVSNEWGKVTNRQFLTPAFDNSPEARENQDVGLNGLSSSEEAGYYEDRFLNRLNVSPQSMDNIMEDPAADDFQYYLDETFDQNDVKILERYKKFNGMEGNTPITANTNLPYTPSGSNVPDNEDLNNDNTINEVESYYEYEVDLRPGGLEVGENNIVDRITHIENGEEVNWYLFRIPVRQPDASYGGISGFKSIRFIRTYLTDFRQPVVLRMGQFRLVGSQWRIFQESLFEKTFSEIPEPDNSNFTVGVVNIEENGQGGENQSPYVLPPGIFRDRDNTSTVERQLNEQSLRLCVDNLQSRDSRAVFKNVSQDLVQYGRLKMFLHADSQDATDGELTGFLRIGTDYTDNYYEIEVPLKITPSGTRDPREIWPLENEIDIAIDEIVGVKAERDNNQRPQNLPYSIQVRQYKVTVVGRPELNFIQGMMIGIRNPGYTGGASKSVCVWANELRATDFNKSSGWAANARLNAQIADVATVSSSIRHNTFGFGGLETRLSERARESTTQYDISANINVDKILPKGLGLSIPMYLSFENSTTKPEFDPLNPDVPFEIALQKFQSNAEREAYQNLVLDQSKRKNFSLNNVRKIKNPEKETNRLYDLENFSFSYAYGSVTQSNIQLESYNFETYRGSIAYSFQPDPLIVEPFKQMGFLRNDHLQLIRDFNINFAPSLVSARLDVDRRYMRTQNRNDQLSTAGVDPLFQKSFYINRFYSLNWDLTENLSFDVNSSVNAIVDEPEGDLDTEGKIDSLRNNIRNLGRTTNYNQQAVVNYTIPLDKSPITDWISADVRYEATYSWITGAIGQRDSLGNVIQNTRDRSLTGKLDLVQLYNKSKRLNALNAPKRPNIPGRPAPQNTAEGEEKEKEFSTEGFAAEMLKFLMMVKEVNFSYNITQGTFLPGYLPNTGLLGMDKSFLNPGMGFILGSQDSDIRFALANRGVLAASSSLTQAFRQNESRNLRINSLVEPLKDFRITLDIRKRENGDYSEIFRRSGPGEDDFTSTNPNRLGSYSISYNALKTVFKRQDTQNVSPLFTDFENYRSIIQARLETENPGGSYNINGQNVLVPAFLAAYSGQSATGIDLNPFPKIPLPNWRVEYRGLARLPALSDYFSSINLTHNYQSDYEVSNFSNALIYQEGLELYNSLQQLPMPSMTDEFGAYIPILILNQVVIRERFAPLVGVDLLTKDRMNISFEYNTDRTIGLNFSNAQVTEQNSQDFRFDLGYTKAGVKVPFKIQGRQEVLNNDLTIRVSTRIVDTNTVQRKIEGENTLTNGNLNIQLRPSIGYVVNQKLNIQFYFDRTINDPKVSTAFRRSSTSFGGQLTFNLSE